LIQARIKENAFHFRGVEMAIDYKTDSILKKLNELKARHDHELQIVEVHKREARQLETNIRAFERAYSDEIARIKRERIRSYEE